MSLTRLAFRDTLRLDGIAPAQLNAFVANGDILVIDYGPSAGSGQVSTGSDRVAIANGMGGDDTMEDSGGPPATRDSRRWRYGDSN